MFKIMEHKTENHKEAWLLAENLSKQFIQRPDLYARQLEDGRYVCVYKPFNPGLMYQHLKGELTLGAYILDKQNLAKYTVLDADDETGFTHLRQIAGDLNRQGARTYLETSRRGGHLWLFYPEPVPGGKARNFGLGILKAYSLEKIEVYPKQEQLVDGPGSLIRVPLGIHRKSGHRYGLITPDGESMGELMEQLEILAKPQTVPLEMMQKYPYRKKEREPAFHYSGKNERLKEVPLMDFLAQFIELRPVASGAVGRCPFHDDDQPSFGINKSGNYWNCFAGCGGGDIISFWMKWKNCDFQTAVRELEEVLNGTDHDRTPGG